MKAEGTTSVRQRSPVRLSIAAVDWALPPRSARSILVARFLSSVQGRLLITLLLVVAYVGTGMLFYGLVENWSFVDAAYFSMVTMSTVGYGDLTPTTAGSKVWTVMYTLAGIIVVFTQLATLMTLAVERPIRWIRSVTDAAFPSLQGFDIDGNGVADYHIPPTAAPFYAAKLLAPMLIVTIVQLGFAAIFVAVEGWDYGEAVYHCFITATTCGYGDTYIATEAGRAVAFFHIAISVSLLGALINEIGELRQQRALMISRHQLMIAKMDTRRWESLLERQTQGAGSVGELDFVTGMLVNLELVPQADIDTLTKLWRRLGKGPRDRIGRSELRQIARSYQSRHSVVSSVRSRASILQAAALMPVDISAGELKSGSQKSVHLSGSQKSAALCGSQKLATFEMDAAPQVSALRSEGEAQSAASPADSRV